MAGVFSKDVCQELIEAIENLEPGRWHLRQKINSRPVQNDGASHYWFCGDRQQPAALRERLFALAPKIEGARVEEACINRYDVGDYMPEHIDVSLYRYNMVVALCDHGDGIEIEGVFHPDVPGRAVVFPAKSAPHSVPPVKHQRYVIIYLYI